MAHKSLKRVLFMVKIVTVAKNFDYLYIAKTLFIIHIRDTHNHIFRASPICSASPFRQSAKCRGRTPQWSTINPLLTLGHRERNIAKQEALPADYSPK